MVVSSKSAMVAALAAAAAVIGGRIVGFSPQQSTARAGLPVSGYTVVKSYPHDPGAFTQGLQYYDGFLYEGTGQNGQSSIRRVKLETGEVLQQRPLAAQHFGEGIVVVGDQLFQLTWQSQIAFVYDRQTFAPKRTFTYSGEGWGLTYDGANLVMSDGSDALRILDPATFVERRRIKVMAGGKPLDNLNELEYIKGEIFANIWMTDDVARIDAASGKVTGWIDLGGLLPPSVRAGTDVLNGIAFDAAGDRLFVTGKWWPRLFEVKLRAR